jgi:cysteine sulfinate desulfinase/cysteine desulfurase-like protein
LEGIEMLKAIGKNNAIRISFGWETKIDEIEEFANKFNQFIYKRRK